MEQVARVSVSTYQLLLYNLFLVIGYIFLVRKYHGSWTKVMVITLFFSGIVSDLAGSIGISVFRVFILLWALLLFSRTKKNLFYREFRLPIFCFLIYLIYTAGVSYLIHNDNVLLIFSQLSRVVVPFLVFAVIYSEIAEDQSQLDEFHDLFGFILAFFIISAVVKLVVLGGFLEGWVGGLGLTGGGAGTSLPLLGLFWLSLESGMENKKPKYIFLVLGFLLIGFATGKRAVWLLYPILYFILAAYTYRRNVSNLIIVSIILVPTFIYLGVRLTPSLNPDKKVWGKFDIEYTLNYSLVYSTGYDNESMAVQEVDKGRVGAIVWLYEKIVDADKMAFFGKGYEYFIYAGKDNYYNSDYYMGILHRGSVTGIVGTFFVSGIFGVVLYILFLASLLLKYRNRLSYVLFVFVMIDYIFYNARMTASQALFLLTMFILLCSTYVFKDK